jgi:hypothetical protein
MNQDIDAVLRGWDFKPGVVQARLVQAQDGRQVIQMRVDLGVLQIETSGRPDGAKPHGQKTYFDYLKQQARIAGRSGTPLVLSEEQCEEVDREFMQFYQRRISWLALRNYARAVADADHTLAFMDFVRDHSPSEEYTQAHEQYRGFVHFHRTQAAAAQALEKDDPESALNIIRTGLESLREFLTAHGLAEQIEDDPMVKHLRGMDRSLREAHHIEATLQEQLAEAVAKEDYEGAAKLRDALRQRQHEKG